ncbi:MAG: hypothetical protein IT304_03840 [Dehalococcoidia bacterium]|nr:hypothetical protein [Dehalococcoidia bacterium]
MKRRPRRAVARSTLGAVTLALMGVGLAVLALAASAGQARGDTFNGAPSAGPYLLVLPLLAKDAGGVLPPSAPPTPRTATSTATPTPTAPGAGSACMAGFCLRHTSSYRSTTGTLHVVGEVANTTGVAAQYVEITADFYSASGQLLATDFTFSAVGVIPAGGDSPFEVLLFNPPPGINSYTVRVTDFASPPYDAPISGLVAIATNVYTAATGTLHMVGSVTNGSATTYRYVQPIAALYDAAGNVLRVDFTFTSPDTLAAGQTGTFDLLVFSPPPWTSYRLWIDAAR